jgi:hypothetical protein
MIEKMAIWVLDSWVFFVSRFRFQSGKEGCSCCQVGKVKDKSPVAVGTLAESSCLYCILTDLPKEILLMSTEKLWAVWSNQFCVRILLSRMHMGDLILVL